MLSLFAALLAVPAVASASMVIILVTPARIVAASDSRSWFKAGGEDGVRTTYRDESIKVGFAGRFVLATTGAGWDNDTRTLRIWEAWNGLSLINESALSRANRFLRVLQAQQVTTESTVHTLVAVFGFGPLPDGIVRRLRNTPGGGPAEVVGSGEVTTLPYVFVGGWDELDFKAVGSRLTAQLTADATEGEMVAMARDAILQIEGQTNLVGGPVHILTIDKNGGRWIVP
jgi:hypothetical protein